MIAKKSNKIDISICIPTYNRASLLEECLTHLSTFTLFSIEVIVGDNASTDITQEVVSRTSKKFDHFVYHRQSHNIGFARNMDAILRLAKGEYIYMLSDDDMVYENALVLMKNILDNRPDAVSINGKYLSRGDMHKKNTTDKTTSNIDEEEINKRTYENTNVLIFKKENYTDLIENFLICDAHPLMRKKIFQQHCMYNDRGFCLMPLYFKLLSLGDFLHIQAPVFQHFRNANSLTTSMTTHWFLDYVNADIEVSVANIMHLIPSDTTENMRHKMLSLIYYQAARMARLSEDFTLMWHFMNRLKSINSVDEICLLKCEYHFLLNIIIERILLIATDTGSKTVHFEDTPLLKNLTQMMKDKSKTSINFVALTYDEVGLNSTSHINESKNSTENENSNNTLTILQSYNHELIDKLNLNNALSLTDLLKSYRLTLQPIAINIDESNIQLYFPDENTIQLTKQPSVYFDNLNCKYSE